MIDEPLFPVPDDAPDAELDAVEAELYRLDPGGDQISDRPDILEHAEALVVVDLIGLGDPELSVGREPGV